MDVVRALIDFAGVTADDVSAGENDWQNTTRYKLLLC